MQQVLEISQSQIFFFNLIISVILILKYFEYINVYLIICVGATLNLYYNGYFEYSFYLRHYGVIAKTKNYATL